MITKHTPEQAFPALGMTVERWNELQAVRRQRDALLAALQEIARRLEKPGTAGEYKARDIARAAIAACEVQS